MVEKFRQVNMTCSTKINHLRMNSKNTAEVEVVFLSYAKDRYLDLPKVRFHKSWTPCISDIKRDAKRRRFQNNDIGRFSCRQYSWYNNALQQQISSSGKSYIDISEWFIRFSDKRAFMVNNKFYREIALVIGPALESWFYGSPRSLLDVRLGSQSKTDRYYSKNVLEDFKMQQIKNNRPISASVLMEYAIVTLDAPNCGRDFALLSVAAARFDHQETENSCFQYDDNIHMSINVF